MFVDLMLTGCIDDIALTLTSGSICCPVGTTKEHLGFALALDVPIFVVVNKIDLCRSYQVERTIRQLEKVLKSPGCKKIPFRIETEDDAMTVATNFHNQRWCRVFARGSLLIFLSPLCACVCVVITCIITTTYHIFVITENIVFSHHCAEPLNVTNSVTTCFSICPIFTVSSVNVTVFSVTNSVTKYFSICPIFTVSSVTGRNLELLMKFLNILPPLHSSKDRERNMQQLTEHQVAPHITHHIQILLIISTSVPL